jgi:hypothetical protein
MLLLAMLAATSSTQAAASEWWYLAARDDGSQRGTWVAYYVDRASIKLMKNYRRAWMATIFEKPLQGIASARIYVQFDCDQGQRMVLQMNTLTSTGQTKIEQVSPAWRFIAPDDPSSTIMSSVCAGAFHNGIRFKDATPEESASAIFRNNRK